MTNPLLLLKSPSSTTISFNDNGKQCIKCEDSNKMHTNHYSLSLKLIPSEVLSIIESYLLPSSCANLSATNKFFRSRWTTIRWCHIFKYHYGPKQFKDRKIYYYNDINDKLSSSTTNTKFNVSSLIPSVRRTYISLCVQLELAFLGFYDRRYTDFTNDENNNDNLDHNNVTIPDVMHFFYFFVGFKPLEILFNKRKLELSTSDIVKNPFNMFAIWRRRRLSNSNATSSSSSNDAITSMPAWKLACLLKEKGMDCMRCSVCDQIDLIEDLWRTNPASNSMMGNNSDEEFSSDDTTWCKPCSCPAIFHRKCLEKKLGLILHFPATSPSNATGRIWISYDDPSPELHSTTTNVAAVDNRSNRFLSQNAKCASCGEYYRRGVRLPRSTYEVLFASLADPLSWFRAFSTFVHFCLCLIFIGATEGLCTSNECGNHHVLVLTKFIFKWPQGKRGLVLAWWQLQQCCMLHIFFSPRFAAIVDRLSFGPISYFYCRLYVYFLITSMILASTLLPSVSRAILKNIVYPTISIELVDILRPFVEFITYFNFCQYVVVSSIVTCIFWRTNYRIFTVANARGWSRQRGRRSNWSHPIYFGHWQSLR